MKSIYGRSKRDDDLVSLRTNSKNSFMLIHKIIKLKGIAVTYNGENGLWPAWPAMKSGFLPRQSRAKTQPGEVSLPE